MSGTSRSSLSGKDPVATGSSASDGGPSSPRQGPPGRTSPFDGRARAFREKRERRRGARREQVGQLLAVAIIILGIYAILSARPYIPGSGSVFPSPGPLITVTFGTPVASTVNCSSGGIAYVDRVPWTGSSEPVTTGDVSLHFVEIWDGDYIPDIYASPNVTSTSLCASAPPTSLMCWYVVMTTSNGTILLAYWVAAGWVSLTHGPWNVPIVDGTTLVFITGSPIAQTGRGLTVVGFSGGSPIRGSVPL